MNNLSQFLLNGLLENESKIVAFYGGGFKPPTKGHFNVVKKTLQDYPEIDKLYIVIGSGLRNNISQDESYSIWNIYKKYLSNKIEIIKSQSPLSYIKKYLQENPEQKTYIIIGSREGDEGDIKDFNERKTFFEKYSQNVKVIDLKTKGGVSGTKARAAAKISFDTFIKFLPDELTEQEQITIHDYIQSVIREGKILNENATYSQHIDYKQQIKDLTKYFLSKYPDLKFLPKVKFIHGDANNASNFFGKTAYYDPNTKEIVLYTEGRHPKDIVRSYSHEFIHFIQDMKGELENVSTQNTTEDSHLDKIEREAYLDGNITFRNWTDSLQEKKKPKDPFGLLQFAREITENLSVTELDIIEKIADEWFQDYGIDVEFTKHFIERVNDPRNGKPISFEELEEMFTDAAEKYGDILSKLPEGYEAVLLKLKNDLNLPFILKYDKKTGDTDLIAKTIMRKYNFKTPDKKLTLEGRYDSITTKISSEILNKWVKDFKAGKSSSTHKKIYENGDIYVEVDANIAFEEGLDNFIADGGVYEEEDYLEIRFEIDPTWLPKYFSKISMWLKDVVRHEIEHLTHGDSLSLKADKYIEDDTLIRKIINAGLLSPAQYFKLEKEIDANLQGMYLKAKKSRQPFRKVIDDYLDSQDITKEEKEEILNIWRNRLPALNLPKF